MRTAVLFAAATFTVFFSSLASAQFEESVKNYIELANAAKRRTGQGSYEYLIRERIPRDSALRLNVEDRPLEDVEVRVRRESRGRDTYMKVGYEAQPAFEGGRKTPVDRDDLYTLSWVADEPAHRGQPLVIAAHNGDLYIDTVTVRYADEYRDRERAGAGYGREDYRRGRLAGPGDDRFRDQEAARRCERRDVRRPEFRLENRDQLVSALSGILTGQVSLQGELEGECVREAGYYENGRLVQSIDFPLDDRVDRRRFSLQVNARAGGELRAYTVDGPTEVFPLQTLRR